MNEPFDSSDRLEEQIAPCRLTPGVVGAIVGTGRTIRQLQKSLFAL
jgi:hypothetical protein